MVLELAKVDYLAEPGLATALFCAVRLPQPLLLEGEAGVGKTQAAKALAALLDTPLIRLQCFEGIDASEALYEWNYPRQLLSIRMAESQGKSIEESSLFSREFLIERPLLQALEHDGPNPAVLLIDEVDRADEEFEAFLLEMLAESTVTVPELGTLKAKQKPIVILTSNRTRDLHDALKRRCLYHWIDYPSLEHADIETFELFTDTFHLAVPLDHPWAGATGIDLGGIEGFPVLLIEDGHCLRGQAEEICANAKISNTYDVGAAGLATVCQMVAAGNGVTLLPECAVQLEARTGTGIAIATLANPQPFRTIGLAWSKNAVQKDRLIELSESIKQLLAPPYKSLASS